MEHNIVLERGIEIRKLRKKNNLTLAQMSKNIKEVFHFSITPDAISKFERGDRSGSLNTSYILCRYFFITDIELVKRARKKEEFKLDIHNIVAILDELYIPSKIIENKNLFKYVIKYHATNYNIKEFSYCFEKFNKSLYPVKLYKGIYKHFEYVIHRLMKNLNYKEANQIDTRSANNYHFSGFYPKPFYDELIEFIRNKFGNNLTIMDIPQISKYLIKWFNERTSKFNNNYYINSSIQELIDKINDENYKIKYLSLLLNLKIEKQEIITTKSQILKYINDRDKHTNEYIKLLKKKEDD